ncbi:MAG: hypothetical protein R2747_17140 [Pyrinomonadaceae bacterium]
MELPILLNRIKVVKVFSLFVFFVTAISCGAGPAVEKASTGKKETPPEAVANSPTPGEVVADNPTSGQVVAGNSAPDKIESIYTSFGDKGCKEVETDEEGLLYRGECEGVGDYKLILLESEHHQSLNVVAPGGRELELDLYKISVSTAWLGEKAEWRVRREGGKVKPLALIVRINVSQDPNDPYNSDKNKSYLAVAKITDEAVCVTDLVEPSVKNQNEKARQLADASAGKPCQDIGQLAHPSAK